jgi:hypothetical protein
MPMGLLTRRSNLFSGLKWGDYLVTGIGVIAVIALFNTLWLGETASKVQIRAGSQIHSTLSLNQQRTIDVPGPLGITRITIDNGKVRVVSDPGPRQYCVKQGWLKQAGEVAVCLPNQVSVELLGSKRLYDSLNY